MTVKTIGILGGMGPEATAYFYRCIIKATPAFCDQDHIPTLIYSNPRVPDRTACIFDNRFDVIIPLLKNGVRFLEKAGVGLIAIPCNTSHYWWFEIQSAVTVPVINMVKETTKWMTSRIDVGCVGILATTGTIKTGLYQNEFVNAGLRHLTPTSPEQEEVMGIIAGIKRSGATPGYRINMERIITGLRMRGADVVALACTELPLLFPNITLPNYLIDPMDVMARTAVRLAMHDICYSSPSIEYRI